MRNDSYEWYRTTKGNTLASLAKLLGTNLQLLERYNSKLQLVKVVLAGTNVLANTCVFV